MKKTIHKQVETKRGTHVTVKVDEGIKDFLGQIWTMGFETQFSCQGGDRHYIKPVDEDGWHIKDKSRKGWVLKAHPAYVLLMGFDSARNLAALLGYPDAPLYDYETDPVTKTIWNNPDHWTWSEDLWIEPDPMMEWGRSVLRFRHTLMSELNNRAQQLILDHVFADAGLKAVG